MKRPTWPRPTEPLGRLLTAYDEALAAGSEPGPAHAAAPPGEEAIYGQLRGLLHRLDQLRPRSNGGPRGVPGLPTGLTRVAHFEVRHCLGHGGFGIVYLASDTRLGRAVALKILRLEAALDPDTRARFVREAQAAAGLDHPHIATVYEAGEHAGLYYIASAFCPGTTLAAWLRSQAAPLPPPAAAQLIATLAEAVQYAHGRGILHRDLKPANVMLQCKSGVRDRQTESSESDCGLPILELEPRIIDFGLAKRLGGEDATRTGVILGTLGYMAPEQARGRAATVGPAADIYALGAILYELLTGQAPFPRQEGFDTLRRVIEEDPVPPGRLRSGLPRDLENVCLKCLEKRPERRYDTAAALADDLRRFLHGQATRSRPPKAWQRGWKGMRRRPRLAAALSAGLLALAALAGGGSYVASVRDSAAALSAGAETARQERDRVQAEANTARQRFYAREIALLSESVSHGRLTAGQLDAAGPKELRGFDWYYLRRLSQADTAGTEWFVGRGHTDPVVHLAYSPDGRLCASVGFDGRIIVWVSATHQQRWSAYHKHPATAVAFSPDGKTLASGSEYCQPRDSAELKLWDVSTGTQRASFTFPQKQYAANLAFSPDGQTLATCGNSTDGPGQVLLWDLRSGRSRILASEAAWYTCPEFSPDGHTLAVACGHGEGAYPGKAGAPRWGAVQLFDLATGRPTAMLTGDPAVVQWIAFTPDGKTLVGGNVEAAVKVWDVATGQARLSLPAGTHLALSPDGSTLAAVRGGRELHLWELATGCWLAHIGGVPSQVHDVRFGPSGTQLAVACEDNTVRLFDVHNTHDLSGHRPTEAWAVAFAPDGKTLAFAGDDHTIRLWNVSDFKQRAILRGHTGLVAAVAFSPDGHTLASGSFDHSVRLWDAATGRESMALRGHAQDVRAVAFAPDGRGLATAAKSVKQAVGELKLWDLGTGRETMTLAANGNCLAFSEDGRLLAFRDDCNAVNVLDLSTLLPKFSVPDLPDVNCLTFTPDGHTLVIAKAEGLLKFCDVETGVERLRLQAGKEVRALAFSPDGKTLASAAVDNSVILWQAATRLELLRLKGLPGYAHALAFSPDSAILAAALHDGTVRLYQANRDR